MKLFNACAIAILLAIYLLYFILGTVLATIMAIGIAKAIGYAKDRQTFGKPIIEHQLTRWRLGDMARRVEPLGQGIAIHDE